VKVLVTACQPLLEDMQNILIFTVSFIFFWFYCVSLYTRIWLYVLYAYI